MIGGEFSISISDFLKVENNLSEISDVYAYSSGRAALFQILNYLKYNKGINRILLPDYICSSLLVPAKAVGFDISFYPIDEQLDLDYSSFQKMYSKNAAVLLINYFGMKDLSIQIKSIRNINNHAIIIEDDVQAYFEFKKPLDGVDFKFTSLRKTFAIPDGGLVKTKYVLPVAKKTNTFGLYKAAGSILKSVRDGLSNDNIYLELFEKGESLINKEQDCCMSQIALKLFLNLDEEFVKFRRSENALYLITKLKEKGIMPLLPLLKGRVPLFIPIRIKNRSEVRKAMFRHKVFCPIHWPLDGLDLQRGKILAESELSLIVDQRYGQKEMDEMVKYL